MRAEPICKEGDVFWRCNKKLEVLPVKITKIEFIEYWYRTDGGHYIYHEDSSTYYTERQFGVTLLKTREEAEEKAERARKVNTKRLMMLEYEEKLNKMLGLKDHFLIRKNKGE